MSLYTISAATQMLLENRIGAVERDKETNVAIWDSEAYSRTAEEIRGDRCETTPLGARIASQAPEAPVAAR